MATTPDIPIIAFQGREGSYHEIATQAYFGDHEAIYADDFPTAFNAVRDEAAVHGVVAVENSLVGSITPVYDLLQTQSELVITGEIYLRISHALIGLTVADLSDIRTVYSHPVALGQCEHFLKQKLPNAVARAVSDTAGSVDYIKSIGDKSNAAIAGVDNAKRLGMRVLYEQIEDSPENYTRFLVISRNENDLPERKRQANKTSLLLERLTDDVDELSPGTLYKVLGCFAAKDIAITKIESRPMLGRPWHYRFYVDCAVGSEDGRMQEATQSLRSLGAVWRELGTYERGVVIDPSAR